MYYISIVIIFAPLINHTPKSMDKKAYNKESSRKNISEKRNKRDYRLVVDGYYNRKAIMQRAWVYVRNYKHSLKSAIKTSWCDAQLKMDEYKRSLSSGPIFPRKNLSLSDLYSNPMGDMTMGYATK